MHRFPLIIRQFAWNICRYYSGKIFITTFKRNAAPHIPVELSPMALTQCAALSKIATEVPPY